MVERMGPEYGTKEYESQVEQVTKALRSTKTRAEFSAIEIAFVFDRSYARSAICKAIKIVEKEQALNASHTTTPSKVNSDECGMDGERR